MYNSAEHAQERRGGRRRYLSSLSDYLVKVPFSLVFRTAVHNQKRLSSHHIVLTTNLAACHPISFILELRYRLKPTIGRDIQSSPVAHNPQNKAVVPEDNAATLSLLRTLLGRAYAPHPSSLRYYDNNLPPVEATLRSRALPLVLTFSVPTRPQGYQPNSTP